MSRKAAFTNSPKGSFITLASLDFLLIVKVLIMMTFHTLMVVVPIEMVITVVHLVILAQLAVEGIPISVGLPIWVPELIRGLHADQTTREATWNPTHQGKGPRL